MVQLQRDFKLVSRSLRVQLYGDLELQRAGPVVFQTIARGLHAVLMYQTPEWIITPVPPAHVEGWGRSADALFRLALAKVRREGGLNRQTVTPPGGYLLEYFTPVSNRFATSQVLCFDEYLAPAPPAGALVAVPNRSQIMVHRMTGPQVEAALQAMVEVVPEFYMESGGGVSDHLYWWRDGTMRYLTTRGPDWPRRRDDFELPPDFLEVYRDLIRR